MPGGDLRRSRPKWRIDGRGAAAPIYHPTSQSVIMEPRDPSPATLRSSGIAPEAMLAEAVARGAFAAPSRRGFLQSGVFGAAALLLAACTPSRSTLLPDAQWTRSDDLDAICPVPGKPATGAAKPKPLPALAVANAPAALPYAKPRRLWARGEPDLTVLNPMLPVCAITVHHDGLDNLETGTSEREMMARIELYRVGHRAKGWGDIGYHLVVDRAGTVWQGRSIRWQGAHVKNHNEGNIGVLVMGNFEVQRPTAAQMKTLEKTLADLMKTYKVRKNAVYTHREWPDAQTACPGKNLQPRVADLRRGTRLA
jgi:hypothetical protein